MSNASRRRDNAWDCQYVGHTTGNSLGGNSSVVSPNIGDGWISSGSVGGIDKISCTGGKFPFVFDFDLVRLSKSQGRIGILGILERVDWFFIDSSSGYAALEYLENGSSDGSLVPNDASGIRN